ncbi:MAG: hypothetical protein A3G33_03540 [Omnitrophica bacterium RIFCSPLOWO2_12_FULL_44_17]|uniref:Secretin/TonB short N-terminal domain-containing protein n=1 Tax=Candidatus Danuiimicrobium aquiferis TaxID=1801832 RepID=A0A1G1KTY1_9BACT|nr:MAG: hypothetical protein A3B72_07085 [Omnitrophica bacterium RIFCSPHIGHO2_02_FULL_45_28]OGW88725.1 MAG: hypothetical protein A3E74_05230 [Omnitrophica bacterium RIFCSPHIGHO2_12_FULL_44_12]OGW96388.1 MAG: hypothetical protein A3G33_03540 [Omnitrophica bacterium RIFCSPLOWO2_12_FULL_44_17]OGX04806.1 MAG: hypothetical protein A3J12_07590 [Omnitrophica bacterium RIFCSPLOWO2_02_FULL_44_11]
MEMKSKAKIKSFLRTIAKTVCLGQRKVLPLFLSLLLCLFQVKTGVLFAEEIKEEKNVNILDTRISLDVQEADIRGALRGLAESFDLNIVAGEDVKGTVTITLKDVRLEDALDFILESKGYVYRVKDNIITVVAPENELATEIIPVTYVKPSSVKTSLSAFSSNKGSIEAVDEENRLIIRDLPTKMKTLLEEAQKLDHAPYQILIEARLIEVEISDLTAMGVTWTGNANLRGMLKGIESDWTPEGARTYLPPGAASTATTTTTNNSADFALSMPETSTDLTGGQLKYGLTLGKGHATSTIDALIRKNKASLLASPTICALDGEEAKIIIGEKFPFRENTLTAVGTTETTKFIDIGTALRVIPRVVGGDDILLELHPEVSSLNQSLDAGPRIDTREATTKVLVKNGQTVVIGGLTRHDQSVIQQRIPILGSIPLVGVAFRNKSTKYVTRELSVFITPYIVRPMKPEENKPVSDELSPRALYNRGVRLLEEYGIESLGKSEYQRNSEAVGFFKMITRNYPDSEWADDAYYQLGKLYADFFMNHAEAAAMWQKLKKNYPDSLYLSKTFDRQFSRESKKAGKKEKAK